MKVVIGIDPDADKNGIAIFIDGKLTSLQSHRTLGFYFLLLGYHNDEKITDLLVSIEDVKSRGATFKKPNRKGGENVMNKISQNVGQCKQAQTEIERVCEWIGVRIKHFPPSSAFKKGSEIKKFKLITGHKGKSNEDQRSAAYFALLALRSNR